MYERVGDAEWKTWSVHELAVWRNGLAFKNIDFSNCGRPIIKIAELKNGVGAQTARTAAEYDLSVFVRAGDILFSWSGNPDTSIDVFRWEGEEGWLNQHIFRVTPKAGISEEFLFFVLRWLRPRFAEIARNKQTTGLGHVTIQDLKRMMVGIPSLGEQVAIVGVLGPLEKKIELNRRMNETLEAMARAIFKDWFVNFGPIRAKMGGRAPYLTSDIWSLFPDRIADDELPKGWRVESLLDHANLISGGTPKTEEPTYWNGPIQWASAKDVSQGGDVFLITTERSISQRGLDESATRIIPEFSTVVVARGATTGRYCLFGRDIAMNQTCYALSSSRGRPFWLNCAFGSLVQELVHAAHGSIFDTITTTTLRGAESVMADSALLDQFERTVEPLFLQVLANVEQSQTLATTRDLLLPKLMSGEIRLREAKRTVEAVA